jgi:hypothetical protein
MRLRTGCRAMRAGELLAKCGRGRAAESARTSFLAWKLVLA